MYLGDTLLGADLSDEAKTELERQIVQTIDEGAADFMTTETPDRTISFLLTAAMPIRFETTDPTTLDASPLGRPGQSN